MHQAELGAVNAGRSRNELAAPAQHGVADFKNSQIWPSLRADAQHVLEDAIGRHVGQSLRKDQRHRCCRTGNAGVTVHQEVRVVMRHIQQSAPEGEKVRNVLSLWCERTWLMQLPQWPANSSMPHTLVLNGEMVSTGVTPKNRAQ